MDNRVFRLFNLFRDSRFVKRMIVQVIECITTVETIGEIVEFVAFNSHSIVQSKKLEVRVYWSGVIHIECLGCGRYDLTEKVYKIHAFAREHRICHKICLT